MKKEAKTFAVCFAWLVGGGLALAGCAREGSPCLLPEQRRMVQVEMFFGRHVEGRGEVTGAEWSGFVARDVAPRFPDGFTVFDATGQWLDPVDHRAGEENSKVLLILTPPSDSVAANVRAISESYKRTFKQQAVGVVTRESCAVF